MEQEVYTSCSICVCEDIMGNLVTTNDLLGLRVIDGAKHKCIGKVRRYIFHPTERRCIGFLVKRPDLALMFRRDDFFVTLGGYDLTKGEVITHTNPEATGREAIRALGVNWDSCIIWVDMPLVTESGEKLGYVDTVTFDNETGIVDSLIAQNGAANKLILGTCVIPGKLVQGFRRSSVGDPDNPGYILVSNEVLKMTPEGGVAAAAGKATAVVKNTAKKSAAAAKPLAQKAVKRTGEMVEAGSFAVGKQVGRASGMFAAFKEEYNKAVREDES